MPSKSRQAVWLMNGWETRRNCLSLSKSKRKYDMGATGVKAFTPIQIKTHVKPTANIPSLTSSSNWLLSFILNQNKWFNIHDYLWTLRSWSSKDYWNNILHYRSSIRSSNTILSKSTWNPISDSIIIRHSWYLLHSRFRQSTGIKLNCPSCSSTVHVQ